MGLPAEAVIRNRSVLGIYVDFLIAVWMQIPPLMLWRPPIAKR